MAALFLVIFLTGNRHVSPLAGMHTVHASNEGGSGIVFRHSRSVFVGGELTSRVSLPGVMS